MEITLSLVHLLLLVAVAALHKVLQTTMEEAEARVVEQA